MRSLYPLIVFLFFYCVLFSQNYNYYFGNLHAHTAFSDGNKDSVSSGVGRPDGSYGYAKLSNNFDFLGISEHNHYSSNHNPGFKQPLYQTGLTMANTANQDGSFLALFGMEYGVSSEFNGHVLIYGFNQLIGWETGVGGLSGNNYDVFNAKTDYDGIFKKVKNNPNAFAYLAHPDFSDYTTDGTYATALSNKPYNAAYDSAIVGMPLRSGLASSAMTNYNDYSQGNYFNYYKKMLYQGYHLGIGYDHDNHYTNFGRSNGGRLVIIAPSLSRANLNTAMKQMNFYGSDDSNAKIDFNLNGSIMGSIISGTVYPTFNVVHNDPDGEEADTIKIWKGYKNSGGLWASIVHILNGNNTTTFTDLNIVSNREYYYFAEIKQGDGQWIVTSPIWYTALAPLSVKENDNKIAFNYFPNPVSKKLNISLATCDDYVISITDVSGKLIVEETIFSSEFKLDLSNIRPGLYSLNVKSNKDSVSRKLIVE
ncbi:T9SS type A sorting domain-containing protein [Aurantibacillus circumpalustris]|uniref:T9SS type A sorting domain-containing protein n=1 Tax=Aurantibacillus circumpalustris TaxID=3036359 RepID=UPI00295AEB1E|nr:T9SS type A sorting domain-containing protein [Aurantibacillus circumpalustris]